MMVRDLTDLRPPKVISNLVARPRSRKAPCWRRPGWCLSA